MPNLTFMNTQDKQCSSESKNMIKSMDTPKLTTPNGIYKKNNNFNGGKRSNYFAQRYVQNSNPTNSDTQMIMNRNTLPNNLMSTTTTTTTTTTKTKRIPSIDSNLSLGCSTATIGSTCGSSSSSSSSVSPNEDHRYLTYGTSAQLQQEYGKFLPWPTLTEFRLRRKLRRFKRRARKLFNGNNLIGKSFNRIQNVKKIIKMAKMAKQDPMFINGNSDNNNVQATISRSSSLTSLLNLIEEANKNLLNSFHEEDMKKRNQLFNSQYMLSTTTTTTNQPPKCPPRLKRAMSSINVGEQTKQYANTTTNNNNKQSSSILMNKQKTLPMMEQRRWITKNTTDSYRIAFVENKNLRTSNNQQQVKNLSNDLDTISVKSLDSYFGQMSLNDNHHQQQQQQQQDSIKQQQQQRNSKILCVRSHFQINDGTIYLEDSDWEMCSEISEPLSLNESIINANDDDVNIDTSLIDMALSKSIISNNGEISILPSSSSSEEEKTMAATANIESSVSDSIINDATTPTTNDDGCKSSSSPPPIPPKPKLIDSTLKKGKIINYNEI